MLVDVTPFCTRSTLRHLHTIVRSIPNQPPVHDHDQSWVNFTSSDQTCHGNIHILTFHTWFNTFLYIGTQSFTSLFIPRNFWIKFICTDIHYGRHKIPKGVSFQWLGKLICDYFTCRKIIYCNLSWIDPILYKN